MIEIDRATKRFPDGTMALDTVSMSISARSIFGVIGRSGAGKSTLLRLINGLETPTEGAVRIKGTSLSALDAAGLRGMRRNIGMIFQSFGLLASRTVAGNVALPLELQGIGRAERDARVRALLDRVGLADKADIHPARLSGGQRQRVGIARALATGPDILLCDEATSALDPETTRSVLSLLGELNQELGLTIVLITHEMNVVRSICDSVAVLDRGRLVETGRVSNILDESRHEATRGLIGEVAA